jgi:hypothetical protein
MPCDVRILRVFEGEGDSQKSEDFEVHPLPETVAWKVL